MDQRERIKDQFARQAATFESPAYLFTDESILSWIAGHVPARAGDRILDVAGGTGALARHLVAGARSAAVLDLVPEMLAAAPRHPDVLYVLGDATAMPFADAQFDLIVSRVAVHHFGDPLAVFREMRRVGTPEARLAIIDMVDGGHRHNELERLRDPSHTAALSGDTLVALLREAGFHDAEVVATRDQRIDADRWLAQAHGDRAKVAEALGNEANEPTGLNAEDGTITQTWVIVSS
jgi:ubiquinone/menaquinone biosynthesis C-methylase UbiE